eukprot:12777882-Ditylum_brightwellii.AAC.1
MLVKALQHPGDPIRAGIFMGAFLYPDFGSICIEMDCHLQRKQPCSNETVAGPPQYVLHTGTQTRNNA